MYNDVIDLIDDDDLDDNGEGEMRVMRAEKKTRYRPTNQPTDGQSLL